MDMTKTDLADLKRAKKLLENPGLAAKMSATLGAPIEKSVALLPKSVQSGIHKASEAAMMKALDVAIKSLGDNTKKPAQSRLHKIAAATSGAVGGAFGLMALTIELPISTTIMLRSIADIAKSEGENIHYIDTKLACLTVFALGSNRNEKRQCRRIRLFRRAGGDGGCCCRSDQIPRRERLRQDRRACAGAAGVIDQRSLRHRGDGEGGGAGHTHHRCGGRWANQHRIHRPFPGHGARTLHRAAAGEDLWGGAGEVGVSRFVALAKIKQSARS